MYIKEQNLPIAAAQPLDLTGDPARIALVGLPVSDVNDGSQL